MPETHGELEQQLIGKLIGGRYRPQALIGSGGMGAVFRSDDTQTEGASVALKALRPEFMAGEAGARFLRESQLAKSIQHPHVVATLDAGHDAEHDIHYLVMPIMNGRDLEVTLGELSALDPVAAVRIALQAARGINAAHRLGIVHRDIKPGNLFLDQERDGEVVVRVCDFGIAKQLGGAGELTTTGSSLGTPDYASPEQLENAKVVDERTDVWSLGATLYEMLCGVAPFSHIDSVFDLVAAILNDEVPHIQDRAPWLEPGLALAVHRALAREPNDRPATLEDFADALRPYSSGDEILKPELIVSIPSQRRQQALQRADLSAGLEPAELPKGTEADDLGLLGRKLSGQYRVLRMIGKGGMGAVYEVSTENGELRAAKVVALGKHGANPSTLQRFAREAKAASAIDSPHVVATHDAGTDDDLGFPYIIMELLNGVDLSSVLKKEGALDPEVAVRIVLQGARGVAAAHGRGVVHRDIKPANLFLQIDPSSGGVTVKVCDFGVAKRTRTDLWGGASHFNLTRSGGMLGSPMYMSPEQAKNAKAVDERTDVWSLAVVLWEALSGQRLWGGQTSLGELIVAICTEPVSRLEAVAPWVPLELARFVHSGLQRDPAQRPQSVPDFISRLESFSGGSLDVKKTDLVGLSEERRGELARRISLSEPPEARAAAVRDALAHEAASLPPPEKRNSDRMQTKLLGPPKKSTAPRKSKPAAKGGTLGLVAVAALSGTLAAGLAYFAMRSAITQDSDSTAALVGAANAPPVSGSLAVEPRDARVFVDGKPAVVSNGSLTLTGKPGSRFTVSVEHGGKKKSTAVQLGGNGKPEPGRVGLN